MTKAEAFASACAAHPARPEFHPPGLWSPVASVTEKGELSLGACVIAAKTAVDLRRWLQETFEEPPSDGMPV